MKNPILLLVSLWLSVFSALAQVRTVTVNTNGVLVYPTNFFTTNLVGTVSGSGSSGYVPKWTGATALGNSVIYDDATRIIVGTGTATRTVYDGGGGTASAPIITARQTSGVAGVGAYVNDGSNNRAIMMGINQTAGTAFISMQATSGNTDLLFELGGAERWRVTTAGVLRSAGAQTVETATGNLTLGTGGGNGSVITSPNGSGTTVIGNNMRVAYAASADIIAQSSSGSLGLGIGRIASTPTNHTYAFFGYHDTGGPGGQAGDLLLFPRSTTGVANRIALFTGQTTPTMRWSVLTGGEFESPGASTIRAATGNITLSSVGGNGHVLLTPNGTGGVGVNTTPTSTLHVNGSEASAFAAKTTNYTLTATDQTILASAGSGSVTMTLPTSVGIGGRRYTVKRTDASANTLTVATTSSQTIDGSTSVTIPAYGILQVISDNANWAILNSGNVAGASATPTTAPNPLTRRVNHMIPQGGGTVTINGLGDTMSQSSGTQSAVSPDANVGTMVKWATAASTGARAYGGGNSNYRAGRNLLFAALVRVADTNAVRVWVAFTDGAITGLCDNDDPSGYHLAGFRWSTAAGDTAWMACTKDGTTLGTTSTGITPSTTSPTRLEVEEDTANAKYYFRINGTLVATRTANLPGASVNMYYGMTVEPTENVSKSVEFGQATIVSDK